MDVASSSDPVSLWFVLYESHKIHLQYTHYGNTLNGKMEGLLKSVFSQVSNFHSC